MVRLTGAVFIALAATLAFPGKCPLLASYVEMEAPYTPPSKPDSLPWVRFCGDPFLGQVAIQQSALKIVNVAGKSWAGSTI